MKRLSIIIPVHNAKDDLNRCLQSIIPQVNENDEILLIEDLSNDGSSELCDQYANEYAFINAYHVHFKGPSPTRNFGIKNSSGQYIMFIDSDDWIEGHMIKEMLVKAKDYQMAASGYYFESQDSISEKRLAGKKSIKKEDIFDLYKNELSNVLWNKIFYGSIIREHDIEFNVNLKKGEDLIFILEYLRYIKTDIAIIDECLYHYISKESGINKSFRESMQDKRNRMQLNIAGFLKVIDDKTIFVQHMLNLYFRHIRDYISVENSASGINKIFFIKKEARNEIVNQLFSYDNSFKINILKLLHILHLDVIMFVLNRLLLK